MDYSVAGLIVAAVALVAGVALYIAMIPPLQVWLVSIAPSSPASERSINPHVGASPPNCNTAATIATIASESGRNTFQPSRIS